MAGVKRWHFYDPGLEYERPNLGQNNFWHLEWTVPMNPNEMTSPFAEKNVSTRTTTALNGQTLLFEGATPPANWEFSGVLLDADHYWRLLVWSRKRNRIVITDHFGRDIQCYLLSFDPVPQRAINPRRYWRHSYTVTALVLEPPLQIPNGV